MTQLRRYHAPEMGSKVGSCRMWPCDVLMVLLGLCLPCSTKTSIARFHRNRRQADTARTAGSSSCGVLLTYYARPMFAMFNDSHSSIKRRGGSKSSRGRNRNHEHHGCLGHGAASPLPHRSEYDFVKREGRNMSKSRHTEAEMIAALKQVEAGRKVEDVRGKWSVQAHDLWLEGEVRRDGCE